jgi:hypothetical protein
LQIPFRPSFPISSTAEQTTNVALNIYQQTTEGGSADNYSTLKLTLKDKHKINHYIEKFQDKFYKIYKKLNVKVCSKDVLI